MIRGKLHQSDRANEPWRREWFYSTPKSTSLKGKQSHDSRRAKA